jgi:hypothetical protein
MKTLKNITMTTHFFKYLAGIDYSMSCPAMSQISVNSEFKLENIEFYALFNLNKKQQRQYEDLKFVLKNLTIEPHLEFKTPEERYDNISYSIIRQLNGENKIYIENYSFASKGMIFHIGENTGVLKHKLFKESLEIIGVSPGSIKKLASGKGNANKELMFEAFCRDWFDLKTIGIERACSPWSDLIDSFYILKYGFENNKSKS